MIEEEFHITDELHTTILMHRDVHFGGQFQFMLDYYRKRGKGTHPEITVNMIETLAAMEKELDQDLAASLLSGTDAEKVKLAKDAYKSFREIYEKEGESIPKLIADLVLSEDDNPEEEIQKIVARDKEIVPSLIELLKSFTFRDPLFPGYGKGPGLAAICLGKISDERAVAPLFELIGNEGYFDENLILDALRTIGEPSKQFLLRAVQNLPLTIDNERAAIGLITFKEEPEVSETCLKLLLQDDTLKDPVLSTYLILCCGALQEGRSQFKQLLKDKRVPTILHRDIETIAKEWS